MVESVAQQSQSVMEPTLIQRRQLIHGEMFISRTMALIRIFEKNGANTSICGALTQGKTWLPSA